MNSSSNVADWIPNWRDWVDHIRLSHQSVSHGVLGDETHAKLGQSVVGSFKTLFDCTYLSRCVRRTSV